MASNRMKSVVIALVAAIGFAATAIACNIPVFRYALERWKPDKCDVILLTDRELSEAESKEVDRWSQAIKSTDKPANVEVRIANVKQELDARTRDLWTTLQATPTTSLPYVVVRTTVSDKRTVNSWHGPLAKFDVAMLLESPVRQELSRRLLRGDSVVWLVLKSQDAKQNQAVKELLDKELKSLAKTTDFPEGLGLPGSELYSEVPLLMQFTVLEIDPNDAREQFLVGLFKGFQPDAVAEGQPLIVPVFGRGRALEVIPANRLDADLIKDLTYYLCGACSCQVKERNPGFDLLLASPWDRELFGEGGVIPPPPKEYDPTQVPATIPIPPGRNRK